MSRASESERVFEMHRRQMERLRKKSRGARFGVLRWGQPHLEGEMDEQQTTAAPDHNRPRKTDPELETRFTYHPPKGDQPSRYSHLRNRAEDLAYDINRMCPVSREKSLALTRLEEAVMWANASIARRE